MDLAMKTVNYLKAVISRQCNIPPEKQVLLVSGGENLDGSQTVCKYSTGTDSNPIFLFSMVSIERNQPPETDVGTLSPYQDNLKAGILLFFPALQAFFSNADSGIHFARKCPKKCEVWP